MRLLVMTADYGNEVWSGIGTAVTYQAAALAARGHAVQVMTPGQPDVSGTFDAIQLHSLAMAPLALLRKRSHGVPLVYTVHGLLSHELRHCDEAAGWIELQNTVMEQADAVCFVSRFERDLAIRAFPQLADRSAIVPNGVPPPPEEVSSQPDGPIVFGGRFTRNKGVDVISRLAPLLFAQSESLRLVLAGGHGDAKETALLEEVAARYPKQCRMAGWLARDELHRLLSTASLVLMPSRYEPFGMLALEAMRLGVPVLASATGGLTDIVQPEAGGWLVRTLKPEKWAEKCLELLHDISAWNRLRRRGPRWVSSQFSIDLTASHLEAILTGIVRQNRPLPAVHPLSSMQETRQDSATKLADFPSPAKAQEPTDIILRGKTVLVTGGSRGIGRAICQRLARHCPDHIAIAYCLNHEAAKSAVAEIQALGLKASAHCVDVSKEDLLRGLFEEIKSRFGKLDIFVSNAARASFEPATEVSMRAWQRTVDLNARAFLLGSQLAAPLMTEGGRIIGITSLGSRFYTPGYAALGAAKAMIESLARYLAVELAPAGINVNVVCGGFIDTDSTRMLPDFDAVSTQIAARTPAGRIGRPEDIAGIVGFLCTPDSDWMRGQTLIADGGYSLCS